MQSRLRLGFSVTLKAKTVDRFGRMVAEVIGGVNINPALVEAGLAFASRLRHGVWRGPSGTS